MQSTDSVSPTCILLYMMWFSIMRCVILVPGFGWFYAQSYMQQSHQAQLIAETCVGLSADFKSGLGRQALWSVSVTPGAQFVLFEPQRGVVQLRVRRSVVLNKAEVAAPESRESGREAWGPGMRLSEPFTSDRCLLNISAFSPGQCSKCSGFFFVVVLFFS